MSDTIKIYLDACCYIDLAKSQHGFKLASNELDEHVWYCRKFLDAAKAKDIEVYGSTLLIAECTSIKDDQDKKIFTEPVKSLFRSMFVGGKPVIPVQPNPKILDKARDLLWVDGLSIGSMDSIHVATAIIHGCSVFITTDIPLIKKLSKPPIKMGRADEFKSFLPDKYKQDHLPLRQKRK